jgi:chromate transporter
MALSKPPDAAYDFVDKPTSPSHPTFRGALAFWFELGLIRFGGPAGQIAIMHRELVDNKNF